MRTLLLPAIAVTFAAMTLITTITAAAADPLWSWGDDDWNHDNWSYRDWHYNDWAYRPPAFSGWGYSVWEYRGWAPVVVLAPYAYDSAAPYRPAGHDYNPYAAYPVGYHFGFWGACGC